ncbi:MSMEG_0569 family flavin-dependent oxidoreductase [Mongoliimonas terrestris]|uniref:MSMEG_0569 family flavin-dependent oxidoreductase n=1 Tax=Mongoliimonas terrestris TaxID=1709001 RepID=UPI000949AC17|nr:MSMEG_0569 family flavin-dependent oxidoreductase [Mongoliimonas terrestris]
MTASPSRHVPVAVIGGGQAGLSMSYHLKESGIDHVIFERHRVAHAWRDQRWDSFCLVTPNWQCQLPGHPYPGTDPNGFMLKDEIVAYVEGYAARIGAPVREGLGIDRLSRSGERYVLETAEGVTTADAVVLAVGGYHTPFVPRAGERLPEAIVQVHSAAYKNPDQLPPGAVLVVGSGQSGCQIAEDLHLAGRTVHLVVGSAPRCPRVYRGRDAVDWLADLGQYDLPVTEHPLKEKVRRKANHYLTGRGGGRDIDLRKFALEGMRLHGRMETVSGGRIHFRDDLAANLDGADAVYNGICGLIDKHIAEADLLAPPPSRYEPVWRPGPFEPTLDPVAAGITSVVWCTGFRPDWSWVDLPLFDGNGYPTHARGVTALPGVYTLGLPWLHTWGSGRFVGVGRDAAYLKDRIVAHLALMRQVPAFRAAG